MQRGRSRLPCRRLSSISCCGLLVHRGGGAGRTPNGGFELDVHVLDVRVASIGEPPGRQRDCALKHGRSIVAPIRSDMVHQRPAAGGDAHHGDFVLVAAEEVDLVLHPLQPEALVVQAGVRDCPVGLSQRRAAEEAKVAETVVDCHPDDGAWRVDEERDWVAKGVLRANCVSATEQPVPCHTVISRAHSLPTGGGGTIPEQNRRSGDLAAQDFPRDNDVEEQTVLALRPVVAGLWGNARGERRYAADAFAPVVDLAAVD